MPFATFTPEQRTAALVKARQVRSERAQIKKDLKSGQLNLQAVLQRDDDVVGRMKVVTLLESLPHHGKAKAREVMSQLGIYEGRRVAGLTSRQRTDLENHLSPE